MRKDDSSAEVVLNIENNGTIAVKRSGSWAVIDIYAGDSTVENTPQADVTINGSLELTVDARGSSSRSDVRVINLLNNHDSLTINGDTEVKVLGADVNMDDDDARASYDGIRVYSGSMNYNGDFALNGLTFNRVDDSANDSYVTGIYSTTIGERILGFGVEVGDDENDPIAAEYSKINLGSSNEDQITVQGIDARAQNGKLSVVGVRSEGENSVITVNGAAVIQNIEGSNSSGDTEVIAIQAASGGQVDVKGGLTIKNINGTGNTNRVVALAADSNGGVLNVNAEGNEDVIVDITGDIDGSYIEDIAKIKEAAAENITGDIDDSSNKGVLNIKLLNAASSITGASIGNVNMTLANGAVWNIEDRHLVNNKAYDANYKWSYVNTLSGGDGSNYGIVNLNIDASTVNSENNNRLFIEDTHSGTHYITLNNIDSSGNYNAAGTILVSVNKELGEFKAKDSEGALYWNRYSLDRLDKSEGEAVTDGYNTDWVLAGVEHTDEPTTSVDTILWANALNYYTWIMESDKLMKRMGDLRHNKADENGGSWVRVRGSKISGDKGLNFENKYITYELGFDFLRESENFKHYIGFAVSYSDGNGSYERGSGDNSAKAISFYNTNIGSKGRYLDLIFKIMDMDNDFSVFDTNGNNISGAMDNLGYSFSAEYGRKRDLGNRYYLEPQGQLTFGYLDGDNYRLNNGISVDQDGISSLLGRVGFNLGRDIDENNNLYFKANMIHEFLGDYSLDMTDAATGETLSKDGSFDDTWIEVGIGATMQTSENCHIYIDAEKTFFGDFNKDWGLNAGLRWTF